MIELLKCDWSVLDMGCMVVRVDEILKDVYDESPWTMAQLLSDMENEVNQYFLIAVDDVVAGFLALQIVGEEAEILHIAVKKAYQGQGLASQLLRILDDFNGTIFLEVRASNQLAQALYQKYGFEKIAVRKNYYHAPIEDGWVMQRKDRHEG